jgi:hypothetical protein
MGHGNNLQNNLCVPRAPCMFVSTTKYICNAVWRSGAFRTGPRPFRTPPGLQMLLSACGDFAELRGRVILQGPRSSQDELHK